MPLQGHLSQNARLRLLCRVPGLSKQNVGSQSPGEGVEGGRPGWLGWQL